MGINFYKKKDYFISYVWGLTKNKKNFRSNCWISDKHEEKTGVK